MMAFGVDQVAEKKELADTNNKAMPLAKHFCIQANGISRCFEGQQPT